jgi:hypothetical protein
MNESQLLEKLDRVYEQREKFDVGTDEYQDYRYQIDDIQDDLDVIRREQCEDHMRMIVPSGGNDLCFNCGSKR